LWMAYRPPTIEVGVKRITNLGGESPMMASEGGANGSQELRLRELARNLWWTWHRDGERVFRLIDPELWDSCKHNSIAFLDAVPKESIERATSNQGYLAIRKRILQAYEQYFGRTVQAAGETPPHGEESSSVAFFCAEFGLHDSLPIYAGGLGVLAGDYLKEASDLDFPIVGVGILYSQGRFHQKMDANGWQSEEYEAGLYRHMPIAPAHGEDGSELSVMLAMCGRKIKLRIWQVQVGRVPLYLLDSNVEGNDFTDRALTERLYPSDRETRLRQEIVLGIGGVRALRALGYAPRSWHLNEGHAAFAILERVREAMVAGSTFEGALARVRANTILTTHTPVPAGHDEFPPELVMNCLADYMQDLGLKPEDILALGELRQPWGKVFNMTVLGMRNSDHCNAVSELHGQTTRRMWASLWPGKKPEDIPIADITNGIHLATWLAPQMQDVLEKYLGQDWPEYAYDLRRWESIAQIPDGELWQIRCQLKATLLAYLRTRMQGLTRESSERQVDMASSCELLDPHALTIGFARRFAAYKRGNLILSDPDRLLALLNRARMPVQFIFAGKAHPSDKHGKEILQQVYQFALMPECNGRLVFIEDYDMELARYLVQGVDVWMNTPKVGHEACGTSGMKAGINGALNLSILDGWWHEGYNGRNGWAVAPATDVDDSQSQDNRDSQALYELLENKVVPLYYQRNEQGFSEEWLQMVKASLISIAPRFSTRRMLQDYRAQFYASG
jgi:starch phosphorylase